MNAKQKKHHKQKKRNGIFRKWHRRLGFLASLFLINLAVTGILLNHYEELELHKSYVSSDWLLDLYGVKSPESQKCFKVNNDYICQLGAQIYFNTTLIQESQVKLVGAAMLESQILLVTSDQLILLTAEGQMVDSLALADTSLSTIDRLAYDPAKLFIVGDNKYWQLDSEMMELASVKFLIEPHMTEVKPIIADSQTIAILNNQYRSTQISHLKLVQDLHSLRFLMLSGKIANDLAAFILIILAITGFITWQRRLKKNGNGS